MGDTTALLRRWNEGEDEALQQLLRDHLDWIRAYVHNRLSPQLRGLAETGDFVQDTVVQFLRYGPRICLSNGKSFRSLLARIAVNVLRGEYRWWSAERRALAKLFPLHRNGVLNLDLPQFRETSPTQAAQRNEREALIRLGLELLDSAAREIIVLHVYRGLSHAEIASRIDVSEAACRQRHKRAVDGLDSIVKKLRRGQLEQLLDDPEP